MGRFVGVAIAQASENLGKTILDLRRGYLVCALFPVMYLQALLAFHIF
jgi:hypothetical protein